MEDSSNMIGAKMSSEGRLKVQRAYHFQGLTNSISLFTKNKKVKDITLLFSEGFLLVIKCQWFWILGKEEILVIHAGKIVLCS